MKKGIQIGKQLYYIVLGVLLLNITLIYKYFI